MAGTVVHQLVDALLTTGAYKATKYLSAKEVAKATRTRYKGKFYSSGRLEILFTMGRPNYEEREFVKKCKKAHEPFPVKKIQLRMPKAVSK